MDIEPLSNNWIWHDRCYGALGLFIILKGILMVMQYRKSLAQAVAIIALAFGASLSHAQSAPADKPAAAAPQPYKWKTPKLDRAHVDALLAKPDKLLIIDLRRPDELTKIGGFPVYFSIQVADLEKNLALIPKDRQILTASNHAGRAGAAGDLLTSKGFKVAGAVGVQNYEEEGGTLTRLQPPAPKPATADAAR
jgi:rhodanese-related sulfurtransferase